MEGASPKPIQDRLLRWFDAGHRDLPWRHTKDPYRILIAEYLLQRTRIVSGSPYYERFLARFPDVASLAAASEEDVLRAWEGLGYYRRARHLRTAAQAIVRDHGGRIPPDAATLATLPGIGPYTAGAVASIAFGKAVPAVDGNVTRVLSRLFRVEADVTTPAGRTRIDRLARALVPVERPGVFNQALMDLGSTLCLPKSPLCDRCPLGELCMARKDGVQATLPRTRPRPKPKVVPVAFAYVASRGRTLLVRRPDGELLGSLWGLPGGELASARGTAAALRELVTAQTGLRVVVGREVARVSHTFSHRRWTGAIARCTPRGRMAPSPTVKWATPSDLERLPIVPMHRRFLEGLGAQPSLESFASAGRRRRG